MKSHRISGAASQWTSSAAPSLLERTRRPLLILVTGLFLIAGSACTTSRAQLTWEAGRLAESRGQRARALKNYETTYLLRDHLVGAALDRIRLLAELPDARAQAQTELKELLEKHASSPKVATFGAAWALRRGETKLAAERLRPAREAVQTMTGCGPVPRAFFRVALELELTQGLLIDAQRTRDTLVKRCGEAALSPTIGALVAFNTGDMARARRALSRLPKDDNGPLVLQAALALEADDCRRAMQLLKPLKGPKLTPLTLVMRGQAALGLERWDAAQNDARMALRLKPGLQAAEQLLGLIKLRQGEAKTARDLLAGIIARGQKQIHWTVLFDLGLAEVSLGNFQAAAKHFEWAARRCPSCEAPRRNAAALAKLLR